MSAEASTESQNFPWEESSRDHQLIWRYSKNPIIARNHIPSSNSIFNSAVVPFNTGYAGVFRCDDQHVRMNIHVGFSDDGIHWNIDEKPIQMVEGNTTMLESAYKYDPRVTWLEDRYWLTWCNGYHGPTIGMAYTYDFESFYQCENAFLPYNRNGVLFPKKINGLYCMLSRPSDTGHTAFGDIFLSYSPDMVYWGKHRLVMKTTAFEQSGWQSTKIGAGSIPIETEEGWLIFYHGVITTCNGFRYAMGVALLDLDQPDVVIRRSGPYLLTPTTEYETIGDVPNVIFPCAALTVGDKISIYYGAADTCVCLAFTTQSAILDWLKNNSL